MRETKKYSLGNQPEEYALSEEYLGWSPEGFRDWNGYLSSLPVGFNKRPPMITLVSEDDQAKVTLTLHQFLMKDAFPLDFLGEARAKNWWNFCLVSDMKTPEDQFIIPMS